jgi:hypothetical protein
LYNAISAWLFIIGTPERASKLRKLIDRMDKARYVPCAKAVEDVSYCFELPTELRQPAMCPTQLLFGAKEAGRVYADPDLRPALDAWDTGELEAADIKRLCAMVEKGEYKGPALNLKQHRRKHA